MLRKNRIISCALALLGSVILAFGLYHVHSVSSVTEGGALGLTLLLPAALKKRLYRAQGAVCLCLYLCYNSL